MRRDQNANTQPFLEMPVFQNWDVVARAWYFACRSKDVRPGKARSLNLCGQRVVLFRGDDGRVRALDGFCPHMGTDLGIGTVKGNRIACFFHHWEFDGEGACRHVPCGEEAPLNACLQSYAVAEMYDGIWVFPDREPDFPLPEYDGLKGVDLRVSYGKSYERTCHHHVTMVNGIDPQHLRTVHDFEIEMDMDVHGGDAPGLMDYSLVGHLPERVFKERLIVRLGGNEYGYSMRYSAGTIGLLTMMQRVLLFGRFPVPALHMIFAYSPISFGRTLTLVQPIYLTRRRRGLWGRCVGRFLLWATKRLFHSLRDEDGKVYDNMRFNPAALIKMDRPIALFIKAVNGLTPSMWSGRGSRRNTGAGGEGGSDTC
jgi:nitrite reductase/ring-hydroxylating ferredoxin subunit